MENKPEKLDAYISKYALTAGIRTETVETCTSGSGAVFRVTPSWSTYYPKGTWHRTREEAVAKAEAMRVKKIASLKKQIAALEVLKF